MSASRSEIWVWRWLRWLRRWPRQLAATVQGPFYLVLRPFVRWWWLRHSVCPPLLRLAKFVRPKSSKMRRYKDSSYKVFVASSPAFHNWLFFGTGFAPTASACIELRRGLHSSVLHLRSEGHFSYHHHPYRKSVSVMISSSLYSMPRLASSLQSSIWRLIICNSSNRVSKSSADTPWC